MSLDNTFITLYSDNPAEVSTALSQLSPEKFAHFASATAFNNASFETQAMDDYLGSQRNGPHGSFSRRRRADRCQRPHAQTIPTTIRACNWCTARMLAWNPAPDIGSGLLSDVPAGVDLADKKDMKEMKQTAGTCAYNHPWNVFIRGNVILAQGFSQADQPHFDDNTESVVVGTDYRFTPPTSWSAPRSATPIPTRPSTPTIARPRSTATRPGFTPALPTMAGMPTSMATISTTPTPRRAVSPSWARRQTARRLATKASSTSTAAMTSIAARLSYGPLAGVQYTHLTVNSYSEAGSIADLNVGEDQSDSLRSRLGGEVSYNFSKAGMNLTPHLSASWQHEFLDQSRGITTAFNTFGGGSFDVRTLNPSRDSALVDAGLNADLNRTVTIFADYIAQVGQDDYFGQSGPGWR